MLPARYPALANATIVGRWHNRIMARVVARGSVQMQAAPERVLDFLRDYRESRERILTSNYTAYRVEKGGKGEGTVYAYHFTAGRRERDYRLHVYESPGGIQESDQLSSFVTTWRVDPSPNGSEVTIESSWDGAGGIAGIFEGFFAPMGLRRIYAQMLAALDEALRS
jgi:Polyketide cyclase / dehydrase and lipid transport